MAAKTATTTTNTSVTAPVPRTLLPPLLACLPTAFVSPHPPPALLPLLSPILRQRVSLLSGNTSSGNGGWLSLLSWDTARASKLGKHLEGVQFEAHPVSGDLEIEDPQHIDWRRLDEETLQCRLEIDEFELLPVYLWVENDEQNEGTGAGWKLAELRVLNDKDDGTQWFPTRQQAESAFSSSSTSSQTTEPAQTHSQPPAPQIQDNQDDDDNDDDDDYWNAYDRTPGRTPARTPARRSPAPHAPSNLRSSTTQIGPTAEELEYFARYATEVQPALDAHDPDEEHEDMNIATGGSTLHGDELTRAVNPTQNALYDPPPAASTSRPRETDPEMQAPRATSPGSQTSVERLERAAQAHHGRSSSSSPTSDGAAVKAETGVRQFISTEIKSLFRLARSVGIERDEFAEMVEREVGILGMLEADE